MSSKSWKCTASAALAAALAFGLGMIFSRTFQDNAPTSGGKTSRPANGSIAIDDLLGVEWLHGTSTKAAKCDVMLGGKMVLELSLDGQGALESAHIVLPNGIRAWDVVKSTRKGNAGNWECCTTSPAVGSPLSNKLGTVALTDTDNDGIPDLMEDSAGVRKRLKSVEWEKTVDSK